MIIQLALINADTGEPIYDVMLREEDVLDAIDNATLKSHADTMRAALVRYTPKQRKHTFQAEQPEVAPTPAVQGKRAGYIEDTTGDLLGGSTDLGY